MDDLERYIERHVTPEDPLLAELDRETHLRVVQPRMISGHLQGRLLEMVVRMIRPQRILEIGTFTGYSAICMARGLDEGGELHTIEANDELEPIASKYFIRSGLSGRITLHIGSALDIAPSLGVFDLILSTAINANTRSITIWLCRIWCAAAAIFWPTTSSGTGKWPKPYLSATGIHGRSESSTTGYCRTTAWKT